MISLPASVIILGWGPPPPSPSSPPHQTSWAAFILQPVPHLGLGQFFQRDAGALLVLGLHLGRGAAIELAGALGRDHHQEIPVPDFLERLFKGRKRHMHVSSYHSGSARSGSFNASRLVRQRSA